MKAQADTESDPKSAKELLDRFKNRHARRNNSMRVSSDKNYANKLIKTDEKMLKKFI
jgi:hypothetical protein